MFSKTPKEIISSVASKDMNMIESLNKTQVFFNRPAKEIFYNLGGFRTCIVFLDHLLKYNITLIINLLYSLCLNNDMHVFNFLTDGNGIYILKHIFQRVGQSNKLTKQFVDILFKILDLPTLHRTTEFNLVSALVEHIVFDPVIWSSSAFEVQV